MARYRERRAWWALALSCAMTAAVCRPAHGEVSGESRASWTAQQGNGPDWPRGRASRSVETELRDAWQLWSTSKTNAGLTANAVLGHGDAGSGPARTSGRFNELYVSEDAHAWQVGAGKKIVGWDVGYGFRPNDVVQQLQRRTLLNLTQEGRALLQIEHFSGDQATSLVWVNPQRARHPPSEQRGSLESALALRQYRHLGSVDMYGFARLGQHTGPSVGAAMAWVASDQTELHASIRAAPRHDGWAFSSERDNLLSRANPWERSTRGGASQALLGVNWSGEAKQSLLLEWWHDATALSDREWSRWNDRNRAMLSLAGRSDWPNAALVANRAWQASVFDSANLRQDNLYFRLSWQPDHWLLSADVLATPVDGGRVVTLAAQWQGDRMLLNAAWRCNGGRADSILAQLPVRCTSLLATTWKF